MASIRKRGDLQWEARIRRKGHPVTHAYMKACKRAGIEDLTFHDLRHEATSHLFENTDLDVMEVNTPPAKAGGID